MTGSWRVTVLDIVRSQKMALVKVKPHLKLMAQEYRDHAKKKKKKVRLSNINRSYERLLMKPSCRARTQCTADDNRMFDHKIHQQK